MPYLDGTERSPVAPKWCPMCKDPLQTMWEGHVMHRNRRGYIAVAFPVHACQTCGVSVQLHARRSNLYVTRAAARRSTKKRIEAKQQAATKHLARRA